jgi:hypothetical protein
MTTALERAKSRAAKEVFTYLYLVRHKREPYQHEWAVGQAIISGEFQITRPPHSSLLRTIQQVAEDVMLALDIPELLASDAT